MTTQITRPAVETLVKQLNERYDLSMRRWTGEPDDLLDKAAAMLSSLLNELEAARARIGVLEGAFYDYGQHIENCHSLCGPGRKCNCGYDETARAVLARPDAGREEG